jgi:hypothetical protein
MTKVRQTWLEKWLAKEENGTSGDSSSEEEVEVTSDKDGSNSELGNGNSGLGNGNPRSSNGNLGKEEDRREEQLTWMDINMVFTILVEFRALGEDVVELTLDAGHAVFEKPENLGAHMNPLFIWGHLDGAPIGHMLVDGGAGVNILPLSPFKKLGHVEGDLRRTYLSLSGFAGDPTEAKRIICKELMVRSETVPMAFFMVDVKGCYNMLLGRDWIHANEVEVVQVDEDVCIAMTESQVDIQGGRMKCLTSRDLSGYDYVSVGKDGFVPISVKPAVGATWLAHDLV